MIDNQELLFVVDENNKPLKPQSRSTAHKNGLWHRTTGIWVINRKKQILCQKRSLKKDILPGYWEASFGGHLAPNEDYRHNGTTELSEELEIKVQESELIPYKVFKSDKPTHKEFQQVFALITDAKNFDFEKDEIEKLVWKDISEVKKVLLEKKDQHWVLKPWDQEVLDWLTTL